MLIFYKVIFMLINVYNLEYCKTSFEISFKEENYNLPFLIHKKKSNTFHFQFFPYVCILKIDIIEENWYIYFN